MAVAGKNGKVVIGSGAEEKVVGIKSWSLELSLETLETTALGDDWKNYIAIPQSSRLIQFDCYTLFHSQPPYSPVSKVSAPVPVNSMLIDTTSSTGSSMERLLIYASPW